jgi:hypothetical protein
MRRPIPGLLAIALLVLGACRDDRAAVPAHVRAEREMAYRQACVARQLAVRADEDLELLEETVEGYDPADPMGAIGIQAANAALRFSRAYQAHADLRLAAHASLDSAANHAPTSADSLRHIQRAQTISIRVPVAGTVEANVFNSYMANFEAMLRDEDHPCNWDLPEL